MEIELRRVPKLGVEVWYQAGPVFLPLTDASGDPVRFPKRELYELYSGITTNDLSRAIIAMAPDGGTITYKG